MSWKVQLFQTARGDYPVNEFIQLQDKPTALKIARSIDLLENYGPFLKPPHIKKLSGKVYELRITGAKNIRILYAVSQGDYHLLHAFKKESQKTPKNVLKIALDRARDLL